jgi:alpha-L-rhamnosidase
MRRLPLALFIPALACAAGITPANLRTEYRVDPLGVDVRAPRLSWTLAAAPGARDQKQSAYQVLAATSPEKLKLGAADLWDSGRVGSGETIHIIYAGKPLASRMRCFWTVRVWDAKGAASPWSAAARWTVGLLEKSDWGAQWIGAPEPLVDPKLAASKDVLTEPAVLLRKAFETSGPVRRATVYVTARGLYELRINGRRVGDHLLAPEWTDYRKRIQYQTYDVTALVRAGANAIAAHLGAGWYAGRIGLFPMRMIYGQRPQLLARLEIETAGGKTEVVATDASWRLQSDGPVRSADILDGETYDARKQPRGWDAAGFDDSQWRAATAESELGAQAIVWQPNEPIRVTREIAPVAVKQPKPGVWVFDMGQNMVGWCRLKARGTAGSPITLRFAEMLNDDGGVYTANLRRAPQTDRFIPAGAGEEVFEPRFTYHGFRYVEVTGLAAPPRLEALLGRVIHSSSPDAGSFETSSPYFNRLMRNIVWTQRANLYSTPTDCPQRDERLGWMGDIQTFSQTAIFNMDMAAFFTKWLADVRDDQSPDGRFPDFAPNPQIVLGVDKYFGVPAWGDAGVIVPWRVYQNYGDRRLLEQHFSAARRWVDWIHSQNPKLLWENKRHNDYNDWLNADTIIHEGWPKKGGAVPKPVFATAFFAYSTSLVARMAAVLGRSEDAARYGDLALRIREAFNRAYVSPDGAITGDTQAGYALALHFDLLPESLRAKALERMLARFEPYGGHLSTGIHATHRLMLELSRAGRSDEAYRLLNLHTFPSWGFMVDNGATTIWERWDGYVKGRGFQSAGMNSFNHWALGAVGEWMWREILGIQPDDAAPGFARFTVRPHPGGGLTWARGVYRSIRGPISVDWRIAGGQLTLKVGVPPNTTATVIVPAKTGPQQHVVGSGEHTFRAPL